MNRKLGIISSIINVCAVAAFALSMLFGFLFGSCLSSIVIAFSFVSLICALVTYGTPDTKAAGYAAIIFAGMYAVVILLVYFAQVTTVRLEGLTEQAETLLNYQKFGLFFNYDLLGYCFMAVSTFFAGLTVDVQTKTDKALKYLLLIHGLFAISCLVIPILGVFRSDMKGADWIGTAILGFWCLYFIPIGILSCLHFKKNRGCQ